jgi:glutamate synthase (ferredoxin)
VLSSEISRVHGAKGLADDTIHLTLHGSGGQSLGAFLAPGVTLELHGDTNDYLGKGLSGGKIIIKPPKVSSFEAAENIIVGNVAFYGATSGEAFLSGVAGERFCVRNSGVHAVIEGVGDHGCEYMTGGTALILGKTGRNFAAGMSGGIAYVWDIEGDFEDHCNKGNVTLNKLSDTDQKFVKTRLQKHLEHTGSKRAKQLLDNFDNYIDQFVKLVPNAYQKVLDALAEAKTKNLSEDESLLYAYDAVINGGNKKAS